MPVLPEMMPALTMEATVFATMPNAPPDMVPAPELVTLAVLAKMAAPPAVIIQDGLRRMCAEQEDVYYYLTVMNENYAHPAMPAAPAAMETAMVAKRTTIVWVICFFIMSFRWG